jgi:hypothetical protein
VRPLPVPRSGRGPLKCPLFETSKVGNPIYECLRLKRGMTSKYRVLYNVPWKPNALEWIEFPDFLKCADAGGLEKWKKSSLATFQKLDKNSIIFGFNLISEVQLISSQNFRISKLSNRLNFRNLVQFPLLDLGHQLFFDSTHPTNKVNETQINFHQITSSYC